MELCPYLQFDGTCAEAMTFYAEVFGGRCEVQLVKDSAAAVEFPAEVQDQVLHARLDLGDVELMGSDGVGAPYEPVQGMSVMVGFDDFDKSKRIFDRLAKYGEVTMPFAPTFWAAGFGMCRDRFGIPWLVNCDVPQTD